MKGSSSSPHHVPRAQGGKEGQGDEGTEEAATPSSPCGKGCSSELNLGLKPLGLTPKQRVGLVGRNLVEEFEVIKCDVSLQLGAGGGEESRRIREESFREKPNLGSGVCTGSTIQQVSKLQYRASKQG